MIAELRAAGARILTDTKLVAVHADPSAGSTGLELEWDNGAKTGADTVLLNLPRHALNALSPASVLFREATPRARQLFDCSRESAQANYTREASAKIYAVYKDAWWHSTLGLVEGEVKEPSDPPVYIRYHDGPIRCSGRPPPSTPAASPAVRGLNPGPGPKEHASKRQF